MRKKIPVDGAWGHNGKASVRGGAENDDDAVSLQIVVTWVDEIIAK